MGNKSMVMQELIFNVAEIRLRLCMSVQDHDDCTKVAVPEEVV